MNAITQAIHQKILEFGNALRAGKTEWTAEELVQYAPCPKENSVEATLFPELGLGPENPARGALVARMVAGCLAVDMSSSRGHYVFSVPSGNTNGAVANVQYIEKIVRVEVPVEKIVEKIVEVPAKDSHQYQDKNGKDVSADAIRHSALIYPEVPVLPELLEGYVEPAWFKRLATAMDAGKHVAIAGPPGGGKSTGPEQYFIRKGIPFVVVNGDAGLRRRDLEGTPNIDKNGSWFQVAEFAAAAVNGWACILNEVNAADPDALLWINGIIETPHRIVIGGRSFPVHPNFRLVITYNPGLVGTKALPQAFKDRFFPIKLGFPPRSFLRKLLLVKGMNPNAQYADRLLKYAADCWALHEKGNLRYQISPRRLFDVVFLMDNVDGTPLEDAIKQAIVDSVDSVADAQMLMKLITAPLAEVGPVSQFA